MHVWTLNTSFLLLTEWLTLCPGIPSLQKLQDFNKERIQLV